MLVLTTVLNAELEELNTVMNKNTSLTSIFLLIKG